ncbi:MAG: decaprenyl-phosphate phosphoribosyltransferase [Bryobacterales bacterium]|nr:decaprenyl-phosphate phosphoribosyltransferase [Bryobacteraceae bacterium]MDW8355904.1 decaprenyl-phosphate phosphoribosyltransferase [Bryobacterales bacterium]
MNASGDPKPAAELELAVSGASRLALVVSAMRPYQWLKNLFVFAPLLFGRRLMDIEAIGRCAGAAAIFSLLSSAIYLVNDVADAERDRLHPVKRFRPVASGALPANVALGAALVLASASLAGAFWLDPWLLGVVLSYGLLMAGYSAGLKRLLVLDAMAIAAGFVLRVVGGAVAAGVEASHWLIVCAFLLALYLAFAKRRQELLLLGENASQHRSVLAGYSPAYLDQVTNILLGCAIVSYALYTVAPETIARFGTDRLIYGTAFVIYGLLRYLALVQQGRAGEDPSWAVLNDKPLIAAVVGWALFNAVVIYTAR